MAWMAITINGKPSLFVWPYGGDWKSNLLQAGRLTICSMDIPKDNQLAIPLARNHTVICSVGLERFVTVAPGMFEPR
jgi:hypothetical protein